LARLPEIASSFKVRDLLPQLLGLWLALLLNRHFKGKAITRAFILLPFIIPTRLFC
jgi:ABC-type sugar transport system permease subunit